MALLVRTDFPSSTSNHNDPSRSDHEVVELQLLLPRWQALALEAAAHRRGMTSGQILRRVITDLFVDAPESN